MRNMGGVYGSQRTMAALEKEVQELADSSAKRVAEALRNRARAIQDEVVKDSHDASIMEQEHSIDRDLIPVRRWVANEFHELANAIEKL